MCRRMYTRSDLIITADDVQHKGIVHGDSVHDQNRLLLQEYFYIYEYAGARTGESIVRRATDQTEKYDVRA